MRRSKAPSQLSKSGFKCPQKVSTPLHKENNLPFETFKINETKPTLSQNGNDGTNANQCLEQENTPCRRFIVVYGKRSTKKHKTWEGDGTLEINSKCATLKDETNKVIGQLTNNKNEDLQEGSRLFIGSKEVEIIECVQNNKKRPLDFQDNKESQNTQKKKKSISSETDPLILGLRKSKLHSRFEELNLPRPSDEHQWIYNEDCLPITNVSVPANLCRVLRPHQREGIIFLYKCISGIRHVDYNGAILADEMGLGKTLQCISLIWTLLNSGPYGGNPLFKKVLIVVPSSLTQNWNNEFIRWVGSHKIKPFVVNKKNRPVDYTENPSSPIFIISYEMFMRSYNTIKDINFDLIICDEGHRLKNVNIRTTTLLNNLPCKRRILLTGTPVQNDLQEFFALADLVNRGILGTQQEFRKKYIDAITASRERNASEEEIKTGEMRSEELNTITSTFILRRTQNIIDKFLPPKTDYVIFCEPTSVQKTIYSAITNYWLEHLEKPSYKPLEHMSIMHALKKLCNHPGLLANYHQESNIEGNCLTQLNIILSENQLSSNLIVNSGKFKIVDEMLKSLSNTKERIVLVSNFTQTLDLFEEHCKNCRYKYLRFDGSTSTGLRANIVQNFNNPHSDVFILLLSSKAGGVGLNLIGGSRLVLYDSDWNPATDLQAMARIWREGQKRPVHIYRLLTSGTIEEKIFQRQLNKAGLSESVVDPTAMSNVKLSLEELKDLFHFNGNDKCITHQSLKCECDGDGSIPDIIPVEECEEREADLMPENSCQNALPSLRMNQLFQWEHHKKPVSPYILEEMCITNVAEGINYVFKNKTQLID